MSFGWTDKVRQECDKKLNDLTMMNQSDFCLQQYLDIMQARMGGKHLKDMKRMRTQKYKSKSSFSTSSSFTCYSSLTSFTLHTFWPWARFGSHHYPFMSYLLSPGRIVLSLSSTSLGWITNQSRKCVRRGQAGLLS